ncbi:MAG: ATP-grasp domain-containing protein [Cyclobacteriaceae bacterium]|jgi:carbamoyl-phosphate synthase large subunit
MKVLIAGLAGASLGTEILKSLSAVGSYEIHGCDISPLAFGLYSENLSAAYVADKDNYIASVIDICKKNKIQYIIPGGEQPMVLLGAESSALNASGIQLVSNTPSIINLFSDKRKTFVFLQENRFPIPKTSSTVNEEVLDTFTYPCIVKPSSGTGGSDSVFLATSKEECWLYVELLKRNGRSIIIQEYIGLDEGEFTVGVLSDTQSNIIGSVAMQRTFNSKLSVAYRGKKGLISSGYSQGLIADFPEIRRQAELIAQAVKSRGPLNVQGRVRNGVLIPFEINPRFSASTYLRTMAGFNEVDFFLRHLIKGEKDFHFSVKKGYYLRSFAEQFIEYQS